MILIFSPQTPAKRGILEAISGKLNLLFSGKIRRPGLTSGFIANGFVGLDIESVLSRTFERTTNPQEGRQISGAMPDRWRNPLRNQPFILIGVEDRRIKTDVVANPIGTVDRRPRSLLDRKSVV